MGDGYWLDPKTQQAYLVTRHELWVQDPANVGRSGIPQEVYDRIKTLHPATHEDELRMAGINAGLVRIRDHGNRTSVQFAPPLDRVHAVLRSVSIFLNEKRKDKFADLWIDNLGNGDSVRISPDDLGRRLSKDEAIMQEAERPITDIPMS